MTFHEPAKIITSDWGCCIYCLLAPILKSHSSSVSASTPDAFRAFLAEASKNETIDNYQHNYQDGAGISYIESAVQVTTSARNPEPSESRQKNYYYGFNGTA